MNRQGPKFWRPLNSTPDWWSPRVGGLIAPASARSDPDGYARSPAIAIITIRPITVAVTVVGPISITIVWTAIAVIATAIVSSVINLFDGRIGLGLSWQTSDTWHHRGFGFRSDDANGNQYRRGHHTVE